MATIQYGDLKKNIKGSADKRYTILANRIINGGSFYIGTQPKPKDKPYTATGKFKFKKDVVYDKNVNKNISDIIWKWLEKRDASDYMMIELKGKNYVRLTSLFKDKEFGGGAGKSSGSGSERQESSLINFINNNVLNRHCKISNNCAKDRKLLGYQITGAEKKVGKNDYNDEPYIDVIIKTDKGEIGISCKGPTTPSLAGGGLSGLNRIVPELIQDFYTQAQKYIESIKIESKTKGGRKIISEKLKDGDTIGAYLIPDMSYEIPEEYVENILRGNEAMGGPIDYMYQGPINVTGKVDEEDGKFYLNPNGQFYSINEYKKKVGKFYLIIRKRDLDQDNRIKLDFKETNREGFVKLFKSPKTGKTNSRIIIQDKPRGEVI